MDLSLADEVLLPTFHDEILPDDIVGLIAGILNSVIA